MGQNKLEKSVKFKSFPHLVNETTLVLLNNQEFYKLAQISSLI